MDEGDGFIEKSVHAKGITHIIPFLIVLYIIKFTFLLRLI